MRGVINKGVVMESKNGPENGCGILQLVSCRPVGGLHLTDYGRCQRGTLFQVALNVLSSCCHPLPPLNDPLRTLSIVPLLPLSLAGPQFPTPGSEVSLCLRTQEEGKHRCVIWIEWSPLDEGNSGFKS